MVLVISDTNCLRILSSPSASRTSSLEQSGPSDPYVYVRFKRQELEYDEDLDEIFGEASGSGQMEGSSDNDLGSAVLESYQGSVEEDDMAVDVESGSGEMVLEDQIETPLMPENVEDLSGSGSESPSGLDIEQSGSGSDNSSGSEVPYLPDYFEAPSGSGDDASSEPIESLLADSSGEHIDTGEIGSTFPVADRASGFGDDEAFASGSEVEEIEEDIDGYSDGSEQGIEADIDGSGDDSERGIEESTDGSGEHSEQGIEADIDGSGDDSERGIEESTDGSGEHSEQGIEADIDGSGDDSERGIEESTDGSGEHSEQGIEEGIDGSGEDSEQRVEESSENPDRNRPEEGTEELQVGESFGLDDLVNGTTEDENTTLGSGESFDEIAYDVFSGVSEVEIVDENQIENNQTSSQGIVPEENVVTQISSTIIIENEDDGSGSRFQFSMESNESSNGNTTLIVDEDLEEVLNGTIFQEFEDSIANVTFNDTYEDLLETEDTNVHLNETINMDAEDVGNDMTEDNSEDASPESIFPKVLPSLYETEFCLNLTFGCCPDLNTPAHGPNQEGCCLSAEFGCCPDNIIPSLGKEKEGCTCIESPFGCCPDGERSALGPQLAGCGCQNTPYGCCPDDYTPAQGEDYAGCSCVTFEHGCCPDGTTVAQGPNLEGCPGCEASEYGCCPDEFTPADGPYNLGCECAGSKFGCCPDGVSEALNPIVQDLNETKSDTEEEMETEDFKGCGEIPGAACQLEKDPGTCKENFTVKWFFDHAYGSCSRFWWSGCGGNINRFNNENECKTQCIKLEGKGRCYLPKVTGPCKGSQSSWYFDMKWNKCMPFLYGGCLGNSNRFKSKVECQETCLNTRTEELDVCSQPKEPGPCRGLYPRFYYDQKQGLCQAFNYTGCQGNKNRFSTMEACQNTCQHKALLVQAKKSCNLPKMQGPCEEKQAKWQFNSKSMSCEPFYYSGCGGNNNQFDSLQECQKSCPNAFPPELDVKAKVRREALNPYDPDLILICLLQLLVVEENQEAWLQITVEANPPPTVKWFFNKEPVLVDERIKKNADGSLKIMPAQMSNSGIYTVTADNGVGQPARKQITLKVHPSKMPIQVVVPNENSVFKFGQEMLLKCLVKGYPIPIIRWYKNNTPLQKSGRIHLLDDHSLVIDNATPIDGGVYTCRATNKFETVKQDLEIKVEKGDVPKQCVDKPQFANCELIVKGEFCAKSKYYADFCCKSCTMAGQISPP
eukprot:TCALIF_09078-PA protein Name:"Similar to Ppn Papilin (Drosophila melanogaster)" AED:0.22 eAED:0.22 QI:0/0/0/0.5/1/0.75/4/0/1231